MPFRSLPSRAKPENTDLENGASSISLCFNDGVTLRATQVHGTNHSHEISHAISRYMSDSCIVVGESVPQVRSRKFGATGSHSRVKDVLRVLRASRRGGECQCRSAQRFVAVALAVS